MSLHLDARQRAMLQEMGITVWSHLDAASATTLANTTADRSVDAPVRTATAQPDTRPDSRPTPQPTAARPAQPQPAPPQRSAPAAPAAAPVHPFILHEPRALYPEADLAQTPAELGACWLVVMECSHPNEPLAGDDGRLLDNMLRAMRLHRHPKVFLAALERPLAGGSPSPEATQDPDAQAALARAVAEVRPAMVLVLGHMAARAALGRTEPLGHLRVEVHQFAGCPAVVSYEPAHLLRSASAKPAAWADLCRALAMVETTVQSTARGPGTA